MVKVKDKIISWKYLFALIPIVLYSLSNRQSMPHFEDIHNVAANFWDYIFMSIGDPYLLLFYIFPLILFISSIYINRTFDYTKLIRLGSYKKWIVTKLSQLLKIDILSILLLFGTLILTLIHTPFSMEWGEIGKVNVSGNEILYYLRYYFPKPYIALISQLGLLLLTTITFQLMQCILYARFKKATLLHLMNGVLYLYGAVSFKILPASIKAVMVPNYLSLFHGAVAFDSPIMPFAIMASIFLILIFIASNIDRNYNYVKDYMVKNLPVMGYGLLCLMGVLFNIGKYANEGLTIWDGLIVAFTGTTNEMFSLLSFAYYVVVFIGFIYFVELLLQRYLSEMSYYTMIRYKSMTKWLLSWFPRILKSILVLLGFLFASTLFIAILRGFVFTIPENLLHIIYHFMVNGFLQLLLYVLLVTIISLLTRDVFKSFIVLLILTICMLPGFRINNLIPVGLNSMGYILENVSIFLISAKLIIYIVAEVLILLYLLNKKDYLF